MSPLESKGFYNNMGRKGEESQVILAFLKRWKVFLTLKISI